MIKIENFFPKILRTSAKWNGLFEKITEMYLEYQRKIDCLQYFRRPDITPFPMQYADSIGANYDSNDTYRVIRQAAYEAPAFQRRPLNFKESWKARIDAITGGDSRVYFGYQLSKSFQLNASQINGIDPLGPAQNMLPTLTRLVVPALGNIMIDLGITPTSEQLELLRIKMKPLRNIYMFIQLGVIVEFTVGPFVLNESTINDEFTFMGNTVVQEASYFTPLLNI